MTTLKIGLQTLFATFSLLSALHITPPLLAAEAQQRPDLKGVWLGLARAGDPRWVTTPYVPQPEFTEWGRQESARLQVDKVGVCDLTNPVFFMVDFGVSPLQILDGGNQIVIFTETIIQPRRIYMDGRGHPDDPDPTWLGHSVGHWEGDTLVVDTVGTNGRGRALNGLISNGPGGPASTAPRLPASDQLHLVERIRLLEDGQVLEDTITIEDSKTYLRPFTFKKYFQRRPDIDLFEFQCVDD